MLSMITTILIKDEDTDKIAYSVIAYVYRAYHDDEGLHKFLQDYKIDESMLQDFTF